MRMDVSSTQAPLRIRVATESGEDSTLSIQRSQSAGGEPRSRGVESQSEKGLIPATMATPWLTDA
jgi:hypothetical protein